MALRFSQRYGHSPVRDSFQINDIDKALRASLWNNVKVTYFNELSDGAVLRLSNFRYPAYIITTLFKDFFKEPIDEYSGSWSSSKKYFQDFFLKAEWYLLYDFIEFLGSMELEESEEFKDSCNQILEREMSAYRFVGDYITPIIDEVEINEIETAITQKTKTKYAADHLSNALDLLSDRSNPDYRNSIKEAISAVESICKLIVGDSKTTLGRAINKIESETGIILHADLKEGLKKLYHYTSDSAGIRHAIKDDSTVDFEDAKYMLVTCSAFVNYLVAKAEKAGVEIS
ncbi:AbiJ-NTD4 domain-containing protein [Priestia megaterium]|uniref:AbiJ-NTD4 domain-containing protein n=1 Tax=Priestia megaterium TaxID=1404 RepID=UPI0038731468|nr:hypothetical protein QY062_24560 [Priestia megaterium]